MPCSVARPDLRVRRVAGKGRGVFAGRPIARDEVIAIWGGVILPLDRAMRLRGPELAQCIQIEPGHVLWTGPHRQTAADWINHSCAPNAGIRGQLTVVAMRDIRPGEEICFDYAMSSICDMDDFDCHCGAVGCRGHVGPDDWRRPYLRQRYRGYFSSFLARLIAEDECASGALADL